MEEGYYWINTSSSHDSVVKNYRNVRHATSFGCYGKEPGQFLDPLGVSYVGDFICVTDPMRNIVSIFSHVTSSSPEISEDKDSSAIDVKTSEQHQMTSVFDVTVHQPSRTILATDPTRRCIQCMYKQGDVRTPLFDDVIQLAKCDALAGICVTDEGNIYCADSEVGSVFLYNNTGEILTQIGKEGIENGEFCFPQFLCYDERNSRLLVSDTANSRVQIFSSEGRFLSAFGTYGTNNSGFKYPSGLTVDDHGRIFVVDQGLHNVKIFDHSGDWLHTLGGPGTTNGLFHSPKDLTVLPNGDLFVTDSLNCRVQHFT